MAEPKEKAERILPVVPGVVRWGMVESRIGGTRGEAYAVAAPKGAQVLIDPLPLTDGGLASLERRGPVAAIVLTIQSHQRSAWRYRGKYGVGVWAPKGADRLDEKPDHSYAEGDALPGDLTALHLPGPAFSGHGVLWKASKGTVLFCGDLVVRGGTGLKFVPDVYMDAPLQARESARRLLSLRIAVLCTGHGAPLKTNVRQALQELLRRDKKASEKKAPPA